MKLKFKLPFILILCGITLWFIGINDPYVGAYGANLNFFTLAAKNFSRFGYFRLHFLPTYYSGSDLTTIPDLYLHHPVLYYTLVSLPFKIFGFNNWVVSVTPIIFSLFTLFWLYKIGSLLGSKQRGLWTAVLGSVFPIMTVFGRQSIFEPAVLSLLLGVYYYFLIYLKYKKVKDAVFLTILSLSAILIDWGGAYFIFPFLLLYFLFPKVKEKKAAVLLYLIFTSFGLALFILIVYLVKGNYQDLVNAVSTRQNNPELFGLTYPWLKLISVTFLRILIYFTPLSIIAGFIFIRDLLKEIKLKKISPETTTGLFFLIFGALNIIFLPAATFGHIYFLLYFVPFFALSSGKFFSDFYTKKRVLIFLILFVYIFSSGITFFKWQQIRKQVWRFETAKKINPLLLPFETVAVKGFPGDIFEQYFFHPTKPIEDYNQLLEWLSQGKPGERKIVFSCWDLCTKEDNEFLASIPYKQSKINKTWLIENTESEVKQPVPNISLPQGEEPINESKQTYFLQFYRLLRNVFQVGQL